MMMTLSVSEYELQRIRNIQRNNARLRALGLISSREEAESNATALGTTSCSNNDNSGKEKEVAVKQKHEPTKKRSKPSSSQGGGNDDDSNNHHVKVSPERKSRRIQGLEPTGWNKERPGDDSWFSSPTSSSSSSPSSLESIRKERIEECRKQRQKLAIEYAALTDIEKRAAKENPTATYEHCRMRVQTMTEKALYNRVKVIERASGKHCIVKMAIFKSCLQEEGYWDLAKAASNALERLKALEPPPTNVKEARH